MQAGQKFGMQTMNQSLASLVLKRRISREEAMQRTTIPEELNQLLGSPQIPTPPPARPTSVFGRR